MLEINDLNVTVDHKKIINNFNLKINDGEIHVLMGPNGVGKSTICQVLMHNPEYKAYGKCFFNDLDLLKSDTAKIAKEGVFLINQSPVEIEGVSNAEMLLASLRSRKKKINLYEFNQKMEKICEELKLPKEFIHRDLNYLMSGGEKKKNELLHLWMLEPKMIILDEIDSGLDIDSLKIVALSIKKYYDLYKPSILIITHHNNILKYLDSYHVHVMKKGTIVLDGDKELAKKIEENGFNWTNEVSEKALNE